MIAEHAIDRTVEVLAEARDAGKRLGIRPECLRPVIAGEHRDVVALPAQQLGHAGHCSLAHLHMDIADVQDGKTVKVGGQHG